MTRRDYYTDAYKTRFDSTVEAVVDLGGRPAAQLAHTYFYPTSGGQPHDCGTLRQGASVARVIVVVTDEATGDTILHVLDRALAPGEVAAEIDWPRRFDHMQHHTGQHILSQAFIQVAGAETVGFHLSGQSVTIDLDQVGLAADSIRAAEQLANEVVRQNRSVRVRQVTREEAASLPLRKIPPGRNERLRLIDIDGFDLTACGGTHVAGTAEVGLIKVVKVERRGEITRVEFCCGGRALADYQHKHEIVQSLSGMLTTSPVELANSVARLQDEVKRLRSDLKRHASALLSLEAEQLRVSSERIGSARVIVRAFTGREVDEVRQLANLLAADENVVALLGAAGERAHLVFCRSASGPKFAAMGEIIMPALATLGNARGGGGPTAAQGGGPPADEDAVAAALAAAVAQLREAANTVE